jgi:two-component system cell cycle sensor histidine kinase/response regulator CckA
MPQGKSTILVVDGDAVHRESMRYVLRTAGYRVLEAADFRGAQNAHQQHRGQIHLLVTALALPGGNGFELSKALLDVEPGIKVLFVSGEAGANISKFYSVLSKDTRTLRRPFEPADLLQRVADALGSRSSSALA